MYTLGNLVIKTTKYNLHFLFFKFLPTYFHYFFYVAIALGDRLDPFKYRCHQASKIRYLHGHPQLARVVRQVRHLFHNDCIFDQIPGVFNGIHFGRNAKSA